VLSVFPLSRVRGLYVATHALCCVLCAGESRATVPLKGDVTKESIEELLKAEKLPAVIDFTDKNSQKIFSAGIEKQVGVNVKCDGRGS